MILDYLRSDVLMVTRVPKLWIGMTDGANRSSSEASMIPYESRIKKLQKLGEFYVNKHIMPRTKWPNMKFRHNPLSLMDEKSVFQNAQLLSTLQIQTEGEHPIITYLKAKAIKIPDDAKILSAEESMQMEIKKAGANQ